MKTHNLILCAFFLLTFAVDIDAASFDCSKATSEAEKLICGDEELSKLDESLKRVYLQVLEMTDSKEITIESQRHWLQYQRDACKNLECIRSEYVARIGELREQTNQFRKGLMYCDPESSTLIIVASDDFAHFSSPPPRRRIINWGSLMIYSKEENRDGVHIRERSKTIFHQCGEFRVSFQAGFWNPNALGRDGAYEFAIVQIFQGRKVLTDPIMLTTCGSSRGDNAYEHDPDVCEPDTAVAVSVKADHRNKRTIITYTRLYELDSERQTETTYVPDRH
jgi:uncharacterized protein